MVRFRRGIAPVREPQLSPQERAYALLREHLDADQLQSLSKQKFWKVTGSHRGVYRIGFRRVEPVLWVRSDQTTFLGRRSLNLASSFCVVSEQWVPQADELLSYMLLIMANERAFQRIAVSHDITRVHAEAWYENPRLHDPFGW